MEAIKAMKLIVKLKALSFFITLSFLLGSLFFFCSGKFGESYPMFVVTLGFALSAWILERRLPGIKERIEKEKIFQKLKKEGLLMEVPMHELEDLLGIGPFDFDVAHCRGRR